MTNQLFTSKIRKKGQFFDFKDHPPQSEKCAFLEFLEFLTPYMVWPEYWFAFCRFQQLSLGSLEIAFSKFFKKFSEKYWSGSWFENREFRQLSWGGPTPVPSIKKTVYHSFELEKNCIWVYFPSFKFLVKKNLLYKSAHQSRPHYKHNPSKFNRQLFSSKKINAYVHASRKMQAQLAQLSSPNWAENFKVFFLYF